MFGKDNQRRRCAKHRIDLAIHCAIREIGRNVPVRCAFEQLLRHCVARGGLLRAAPANGRAAWAGTTAVIDGLLSLSFFGDHWLRPAELWKPHGCSLLSRFASLANHLLARGSAPAFMVRVWFEGREHTAKQHQKWFTHLARGHSIHSAALPIPYTKRMARHFLEAPDHLNVNQAIRWGQVRGLGADRPLAAGIAGSRLGNSFEHEKYWRQVIGYLIHTPEIKPSEVGILVEYLNYHKRLAASTSHVWQRRLATDLLLRRARRWCGRNPVIKHVPLLQWKPSGLAGMTHYEEHLWESQLWCIRELLNSAELHEEGRMMNHCVGTYTHACRSHRSSIWSMTCTDPLNNRRRELTIEVRPDSHTIVQARGKSNTAPSVAARRVMNLWARREGLSVCRWI